jgi:hypothetical protein
MAILKTKNNCTRATKKISFPKESLQMSHQLDSLHSKLPDMSKFITINVSVIAGIQTTLQTIFHMPHIYELPFYGTSHAKFQ